MENNLPDKLDVHLVMNNYGTPNVTNSLWCKPPFFGNDAD
jgi:hypothetical protein